MFLCFNTGRGLVSTHCRVNRVEELPEGSCSHRTHKYTPCIKIFVSSCSVDCKQKTDLCGEELSFQFPHACMLSRLDKPDC